MGNTLQIKRSLLSAAPSSLAEGEMAYVFGTDTLYIGAPSNTIIIIAGASTFAKLVSPAFTGNPTAPTQASGNNTTRIATTAFVADAVSTIGGSYQPSDADLTQIAAIVSSNDDIIQKKAGSWTNRTVAQFKTDLNFTKADVGLGNADNTSDANKPVSSAQQTALNLKANIASPTFTGTVGGITAAMVGLGNVDNTSDANKPVSTAQAAADLAAENNAKAYADTLVLGLLDDRGNYDASGNTFPASGGSGAAGAVKKGDLWTVSVAGTLGSIAVTPGDLVRALTDTPGQTAGNWAVSEANIGYVAENVTNKVTSISGGSTDTQYPSAKLTYDQLALKLTKSSNLSDLTNAGTARTNLGLGSMATQAASAVAITGGSIDGVTIDGGTF